MNKVRDKVAVVTGAGSGLGRLLAGHLAGDGAKLALLDLDESALAEVGKELSKLSPQVETYLCDVSNRKNVYCVADQVHADLGPVDILVNNAGIVASGSFLDIPDEIHQKVLEVNLNAHFWTTRAFLPDMIKAKAGHLLVIASAAGVCAMPEISSYVASKFGAVGLAESLRMEIGRMKLNIPVTIVCPSLINTGMFDGAKAPLFTPIMPPEIIAKKIYSAFKKDRPYVREPFLVKALPVAKALLPTKLFNETLRMFGMHSFLNDITIK